MKEIKYGFIIIAILVFGFGLWAGFAPINSASVCQGSVVLDSNRKIIQHLEGGIIEQIFVKDLGVNVTNRIQQLKVEEPPKRKGGIKVKSVAELVSKLKNEAKVI